MDNLNNKGIADLLRELEPELEAIAERVVNYPPPPEDNVNINNWSSE